MKFAFYTTLIIGIINTLFQVSAIFTAVTTPAFMSGNRATVVIRLTVLFTFGIMACCLFVAAFKIKKKIKADTEKEIESAFLKT